jgi:hypothetical protein
LSAWLEFPPAPCLAGKKLVVSSRLDVEILRVIWHASFQPLYQEKTCNSAHGHTSLSNDTIDSVLQHRELCRAKDLSASPRMSDLTKKVQRKLPSLGLAKSPKDPGYFKAHLAIRHFKRWDHFQIRRIKSNNAAAVSLQLVPPHTLWRGFLPYDWIEIFLFVVVHEFLKQLCRGRLGILRQAVQTTNRILPHLRYGFLELL